MTIEISYFRSNGTIANIVRDPLSSESIAITASPVSSASTGAPTGALVLSLTATEAARFEYAVSPSATATSHYVAAGERLWMQVTGRNVFSLRTA
jgi:hypothetical protein